MIVVIGNLYCNHRMLIDICVMKTNLLPMEMSKSDIVFCFFFVLNWIELSKEMF